MCIVWHCVFVFLFLSLFLEANSTAPDSEEAEWKGRGGESRSGTSKTSANGMAVQNAGKVKFDPPSVPVIFVLGKDSEQEKKNIEIFYFRL